MAINLPAPILFINGVALNQNQLLLISKRNIKNILIDSFYEILTQQEDANLMGYLRHANGLINKTYRVISTIILKGGGALRLYDKVFKDTLGVQIPLAPIIYGEKISDIDVDLISDTLTVDQLDIVSLLILETLRTTFKNQIMGIIEAKVGLPDARQPDQRPNPLKNAINAKIRPPANNPNDQAYLNMLVEYKNYFVETGALNGNDVLNSITLLSIDPINKVADTIVYRNANNTLNITTNQIFPTLLAKVNDPFDITFNKDLVLCKASLSEFSLARLRINFNLLFELNLNNGAQIQAPAILPVELYDVGIPKTREDSETFKRSHQYLSGNIDIISIHNTPLYSLMYCIKDLINVLFVQALFPWDDKKYAKRIKRLMYYSMLYDLECKSKIKVSELLDSIHNTFSFIKSKFTGGSDFIRDMRTCITKLYLLTKTLSFNKSAFVYFVESNIQVILMILFVSEGGMYVNERRNFDAYVRATLGTGKCNRTDLVDDYIKILTDTTAELDRKPGAKYEAFRKHIGTFDAYLQNILNILKDDTPDKEPINTIILKLP
jgi:hypothetical protein